jgi:hypothetical protein
MKKIAASGGPVHVASSLFSKVIKSEYLNLKLFTSFCIVIKGRAIGAAHVHHLYDIPWAPSSFVQKVSTIMCKLQLS